MAKSYVPPVTPVGLFLSSQGPGVSVVSHVLLAVPISAPFIQFRVQIKSRSHAFSSLLPRKIMHSKQTNKQTKNNQLTPTTITTKWKQRNRSLLWLILKLILTLCLIHFLVSSLAWFMKNFLEIITHSAPRLTWMWKASRVRCRFSWTQFQWNHCLVPSHSLIRAEDSKLIIKTSASPPLGLRARSQASLVALFPRFQVSHFRTHSLHFSLLF